MVYDFLYVLFIGLFLLSWGNCRWKFWSFDTLDLGVDWKIVYRERLVWQRLVYPAVRVLAALNFTRENVSYDTMFQVDKMLQGNDGVPAGLMDAVTEVLSCRDRYTYLP